MDGAVRAARQAMNSAQDVENWSQLAEHTKFLEYHAAIFRMLSCESSSDFEQAQHALGRAKAAAEDPNAPQELFPNYIWDKIDLDTYHHLIEAQRLLVQEAYAEAINNYDHWIHANQARWCRFRFKNILVRRHFAAVLKCCVGRCTGCETCQVANETLSKLARAPFIGAAGRYLAATGATLQKAAGFDDAFDITDIARRMRSYLPILAHSWELRFDASEEAFNSLPAYFTSVPLEARRLMNQRDCQRNRERLENGRKDCQVSRHGSIH